jgi:PLP dependent protein
MFQNIRENAQRLRAEIPVDVSIVAAVKGRTAQEIAAALDSGIAVVGENYIQEAFDLRCALSCRGEWHFIGHLQLNKVKKAVELFDVIQTVDSLALAKLINQHSAELHKIMPVMIEVNIGREPQKNGVMPESVPELANAIAEFPNLRLTGLMTMGPDIQPRELRPFFKTAHTIYDQLKRMCLAHTDIRYLSMGMSDSYQVAIEEGSNMVRLGTAIFGPRV